MDEAMESVRHEEQNAEIERAEEKVEHYKEDEPSDVENEDVRIWRDKHGWQCLAKTHNFAGDFYIVNNKPSRSEVVSAMRERIHKKHGFLLENPLLKQNDK